MSLDERPRLFSYYGGKARMTEKIKRILPKGSTYVEPFFGSGAVFFSLDNGHYSKAVINDMEEGVIQFIRLLASEQGEELIERLIQLEPDKFLFWEAKHMEQLRYHGCSDMERAVFFYITMTQSYNCLRKNFRKGMNKERYQKQIANGLPTAREKLQGVEILQGDAYDVIMQYKDDPTAVLFIDSPYVHRTRTAPNSYYHEMRDADQVRMLLAVRDAKAKCILCGYQEEHDGLYDRYLLSQPNWNTQLLKEVTKPCANQRGSVGKMAQEWVWKNFES